MTAMRKKIECCRYCDKRHQNCHADCEDYKRECVELDELRSVIKAERTAREEVHAYNWKSWKRVNPKKPPTQGGRNR